MNKRKTNSAPPGLSQAKKRLCQDVQSLLLGSSFLLGAVACLPANATEKPLPLSKPPIDISSNKMLDDRQGKNVYTGNSFLSVAHPSTFSGSLSELPRVTPWEPGHPVKVANPRNITAVVDILPPVNQVVGKQDKQLMSRVSSKKLITDLEIGIKTAGFDFNGVTPPDPTGEVGEKYFIHSINSSGGSQVAVYDKTNGNKVVEPFLMASLAASGSPCNTRAGGDPIVVYDEYAKRWLLSEFTDSATKRLCVYISKTSDPISGGWHAYEFETPEFPDYPKYSVWGGNYYVSANESGGAVYALERAKLLNGEAATLVRKTVPKLNGFGFQSITPVDADGLNPPAAGTPGLFIRHRDDELHNSGSNNGEKDYLELWTFTPDFANGDNSKLEGPFNIEVGEFDTNFTCPDGFGCLTQKPEPGQTLSTLDPLREVVNFRVQHRNFNSHQSITGTFVTKLDANNAGLRWFELRNSDAGWVLHQEGMVPSNDSNSRYMAGSAMDGDGNMALAYMITGPEQFPSLRVTGRRMGDAAGSISAAEKVLVEADGAIASERNGDYAQLSVDPIDNCTFWYTAEHGGAGAQWKTAISSFKFPGCTGVGSTDPGFSISASNNSQEVCVAGELQPMAVTISGYNNFDKSVTLSYVDLAAGLTGQFSTNPVAAGATSNAVVTVASGTAAGDYNFKIKGVGEGADDRTVGASVKVVASEQTATLTAPANGAIKTEYAPELSWSADGYVRRYTVEIASDESFNNIVATGQVSGGTKYRPSQPLPQSTKFFWRVKAANSCGTTTSGVFNFTTGTDKDRAEALAPNAAKTISAESGANTHYYIDIPAGVDSLTLETSGGEGDVDLYAAFGKIATAAADLVCRSENDGNAESCEITDVTAGTYFITTVAYAAYNDVELIAKYVIPNTLPVAVSDSFTVQQDSESNSLDVLANDTDADDGDVLSIASVSYGGTGTVTIAENKIAYKPAAGFFGTETFGYVAKDTREGTAQGFITVTVERANVAPVAGSDTFTLQEGSAATTFDVLANDRDADGDSLTLSSINYSGTGTVTIASGKISYKPAAKFSGADNFSYEIKDSRGATATGNVSVTVTKKPSSGGGSTGVLSLIFLSLFALRKRTKK